MKSEKYGERRGAAFGLAGVVKGFGITSLKKYGIVSVIRDAFADRFVPSRSNLITNSSYTDSWLISFEQEMILFIKNLKRELKECTSTREGRRQQQKQDQTVKSNTTGV